MSMIYNVTSVTLHVRVSNVAAQRLYNHTLGFQTDGIEEKYYADGENAFAMSKTLARVNLDL